VDEEKRVVVALSSFAGKAVRGVARCSPNDTWDVRFGKRLAEARCSAKIAHKRLRRAEEMVKWSSEAAKFYDAELAKYRKYEEDALEAVKKSTAELKKLEETL
jgi:hypothetical protein